MFLMLSMNYNTLRDLFFISIFYFDFVCVFIFVFLLLVLSCLFSFSFVIFSPFSILFTFFLLLFSATCIPLWHATKMVVMARRSSESSLVGSSVILVI